MLKKQNRLKTNFEFNITRKYGEKHQGADFFMYILKPDNYGGETKVGVVVSNKLAKSAVQRNRVKRVFREVVRKNFEKLSGGYWIVLHPRSTSLKKGYEEINTDFNKTLQKITLPG